MSDLRLITILPPQQVQGVQQPQVSGNTAGQSGIAAIPVGSILSGFIINRDNSGNPILRTDNGDITFTSNFFLKIGSEITIRIENIAGNNTAHILSVNGQPPEIAVLQSGLSNEPEVIVSVGSGGKNASAGVSAGVSESINNVQTPVVTVKGTIISTPQNLTSSSPALTTAPTPRLPNGSQVALKIINISVPIATPTTVTPSETPQTQAASVSTPKLPPTLIPAEPQTQSVKQPATPSYASYARFAATPANTPQTQNTPAPASATTPTLTPIQTQPAQLGQIITTSVISNDPNGEAIIQSPIGIIRLQAGTALPVGSHVTFEIAEIKTSENATNFVNPAVIATAAAPVPITALARNAGALSDIFSLLSGLGTQDSLNFVNNNIPNIGQPNTNSGGNQQVSTPHNFMAAILGFTSALKSGDFRDWLGKNNAKWLEDNGHDGLLKKAEGEFMSLSRQFTNPPAQQWQSLFFPIAVEGELQQTRLFVKRDRKQKEGNDGSRKNEDDTRFVLEMDMSQLGAMQMDGFVKRNNQNIQFDLVIRSHTSLSPQAQKDIMYIYNDMGELTGYKGSLIFQNVKEFPVNPMEEIIGDNIEGVVA